ncbi:hypothetical protein [Nocardia goodfellowii]|uniref:Ferredoxin n=1 Tax=Nocardia goodfellowii TaxID=882446 RepID=A0ABS4QNJ9_9NOCA|nr:hypothetical protein [Nocardia goodfellowii]MBP2192653.1 hypothetical protein [Nocardia goodfellowii]
MVAVCCQACGNQVSVVKFSPAHTSVQWTGAAARTCPEAGDGPFRGCPALRRSIEDAVDAGTLALHTREQDLL